MTALKMLCKAKVHRYRKQNEGRGGGQEEQVFAVDIYVDCPKEEARKALVSAPGGGTGRYILDLDGARGGGGEGGGGKEGARYRGGYD